MTRLEEIQDEIAQSMGFENLYSVDPYADYPELDRIYNLSAIQYAKECVIASLQKISNCLDVNENNIILL